MEKIFTYCKTTGEGGKHDNFVFRLRDLFLWMIDDPKTKGKISLWEAAPQKVITKLLEYMNAKYRLRNPSSKTASLLTAYSPKTKKSRKGAAVLTEERLESLVLFSENQLKEKSEITYELYKKVQQDPLVSFNGIYV